MKKKTSDLHILIDLELKNEYKKYCIDKNIIMSDRIRELMQRDLKSEIKK